MKKELWYEQTGFIMVLAWADRWVDKKINPSKTIYGRWKKTKHKYWKVLQISCLQLSMHIAIATR